jgi:hypothetical protein
MSWQGNILNRVLKRTMKPMMFSGRLTRARMGISAWLMEASAGVFPAPAGNHHAACEGMSVANGWSMATTPAASSSIFMGAPILRDLPALIAL